MAIIALNTLIGFVSEMRSAAALNALQELSKGMLLLLFLFSV
jgi:magnesium-transporting ATPase (P-type)